MVLTDDEIAKLGCDHGKATECEGYKHNTLWFDGDCTDFARAIEQAVIQKIKAQGAVVYPAGSIPLYAIPEETCTTS